MSEHITQRLQLIPSKETGADPMERETEREREREREIERD
jgi:hypothetical protein